MCIKYQVSPRKGFRMHCLAGSFYCQTHCPMSFWTDEESFLLILIVFGSLALKLYRGVTDLTLHCSPRHTMAGHFYTVFVSETASETVGQ